MSLPKKPDNFGSSDGVKFSDLQRLNPDSGDPSTSLPPYLRDQLTPPPLWAPINYYYSFLLLFFKLLSQGPCAVRKSERKRNYIELCDKSYAGGYLQSRYNFLFHEGVKGLARVTQPLIKNMMSTQACLSQRLHHSTLFHLPFNFMKSLNLPSITFFLLEKDRQHFTFHPATKPY